MNPEPIIIITDLKKTYGSDEVLGEISLKINRGEIFCILGSDGSGKTSFIEMLIGLKKPTSGEISILDFNLSNKTDLREVKKITGVLLEEFHTHDNLSVKENILFWGRMYDEMIDIEEILEIFKLKENENIRYKKLSPNLRRKLGLAIAFINNPEIVFLDEPSAGLDQFSRKEIWEILKEFRTRGKTIVLTTNIAIEPQVIADRVAILHKGLIKDIGTPIELIDRYSSGNKIIIRFTNMSEKQKAIKTLQSECPLELYDDEILISSDEMSLLEILAKLDRVKVRYSDIITQTPTLNDVFITLTGEKLSINYRI
ncbi:MAG: ABC transporter ATP-binding protein [Asgard group archaeon]|nr:ABC transporter ATP-binding protein [Asgard group archaeon]